MPLAAAFATVTAALCLGPIFLTGVWFFPTVFGILVVGAGCEAARRTSASRATVPLGGLVALLLYLLVRYANDQAWLGLVPTTGSVDGWARWRRPARRTSTSTRRRSASPPASSS